MKRNNKPKKTSKLFSWFEIVIEKNLLKIVSMYYSFIFSIVKIIFAFITNSYFFIISAFYTLFYGIAKLVCLKGERKVQGNVQDGWKYYIYIALLIISGSIAYLLYSIRLFYIADTFKCSQIVGIAIAALSFTELIIAIKNLFKKHSVLNAAAKLMSFSTSLFALCFTQVAIMSFSSGSDNSLANAIGGLVFSCVSIFIGLYMIIRVLIYRLHNKKIPKVSE